ncbi:MAG: group III truncated hemoglobin [Flavobacteriales bacterium]|nr:group III truncated hemoglobin [Flavobacteriales bacterium]
MKPAGARILLDHQNAWDHLGGCLLQVTPEEQGRFQITACLATVGSIANQVAHRNDTTTTTQNDGAMWSVSLGTHAQCGPWLITDHLSRTKQILVQDTKNRIALISCTGKLMWQRELDGPIMGGVHQVDKFKNGKLQMLFNTAERMYVIDRNGKDVERFPIRLPERTSAPLNVFDYENKKEYRVLVPTEGSRLLNFDINGKPVDGWVPPRTIGVCEIPVEHMRIRGKDHLVLVDIGGHVNVFDRRGEPRYAPKLQARSVEHFIGLVPAMDIGDCLLLWRDTEGNNLSGKFSGGLDTLRVQTTSTVKQQLEEMVAEGASPGDPIMAKGTIRYPSTYRSFSEKPRTLNADINLDGRPELIARVRRWESGSGFSTVMLQTQDISTSEDIHELVERFYRKLVVDPVIGHFFVGLDLEHHIPRIASFWEMILLNKPGYVTNVTEVHLKLNQRIPMERVHFDQLVGIVPQFSGRKICGT